jgi:hypothetical protein
MIRYLLVATTTAIVCFAVAAVTGFAAYNSAQRNLTARPGDAVFIPSLDLLCFVWRHNTKLETDPGALMYCARESAGNGNSRTVSVTRFHYEIGNGERVTYRVGRTP